MSKVGRPRKSAADPICSIALFIPGNLNLLSILPADKKKKIHHYALFCSLLIERQHLYRGLMPDDYIRLDSRRLQWYLTTKLETAIVSDLERWGIIEIDKEYKIAAANKGQGICRGYRFSDKYRFATPVPIEVHNRSLWKKLKIEEQEQTRSYCPTLAFLFAQFARFRFDFSGARSFLCSKEEVSDPIKANASIKHRVQHQEIPHTNPIPYVITFSEIQQALFSINYLNEAIHKKRAYLFHRDATGNRLHTNLTNLKRELRKFLYLETGQKLVCVDVGECQPFLFAAMLNVEPGEKPVDVQRYIELTQKREFYRYMIEQCKLHGIDVPPRDIFKGECFGSIFYCSTRWMDNPQNQYGQLFKELFPNVYQSIKNKKAHGHKRLPVEMQQRESALMIDTVCGQIAALQEPDFFCATIHDGIVTTADRVPLIKRLIAKAFIEGYGLKPTVKVEPFSGY